jgi:CheY-like chemotaxis protein
MTAKRILCVEDDADTRVMLKTMLGYSDFEAAVAPDADAALRLMGRERFSLYVLDGGLRGVNGLTLCEQIRASDARPSSSSPAKPSRPTSRRGCSPGRTPTSSSRTPPG